MEKSGAQRRLLPNLNPSTLQTLFPKPQGAKPAPRPSMGTALSLGGALGGALGGRLPQQRRLITDQEMLAFPRGSASTSPPGAFKPRRVNFTPKEVDVLLQAVRTHRELVLYGVAGGRGWSNAWVNIAATVSQADKIHRSESDVRKKWTYLKWEAKNTSKPGRDATSRAVLNILNSQDEDGNVSARDLYEELTNMVPPQIGKVVNTGVQPPPTAPRRIHMKVLAPKPSSPPPPPPPPEVCLRWNSYHSNMQATFPALLTSQRYVDVTLACEGRSIQCHKMMLSACSTYFDELLSQNPCQHPIVLMKDLKFWEIQALVDFMYRGEVNVSQDKLPSLLAAAEALQIKGLAGPASVPGPSSHDQPDEASAPLLEHFAEADLGGNVLAALGAAPQQGRRVRRRRVVAAASAPTPLTSHNSPAKASPSGSASSVGGQRSLLAVGRKRRMEPLPQPMRIKLEPPDDPQEPDEPGTDNDQDPDDDRFTIDTTAMDAEHDENAGDTDPGPSCNNGTAAEPDSCFDDDPNPLLPEVVMAPDQGSN